MPIGTTLSSTARLRTGAADSQPGKRRRPPSAYERFQHWRKQPPGLWGAMLLPVPVLAGLTLLLHLVVGTQAPLSWLSERVCEMAWLVVMSMGLATAGQAFAKWRSEAVWRSGMGRRHLDYSPRRWHYTLTFAIAAIPIVLLQVSPACLDAYLDGVLRLQRLAGVGHASLIGYTPNVANLMVLVSYVLVDWQARRWILNIPPGRILGLHRELQRLGGRVGWRSDAWNHTVAECVDRWLSEHSLPDATWLLLGDGMRQQRMRFAMLRKEILAAWSQTPPDVPRLQNAVANYRKHRAF